MASLRVFFSCPPDARNPVTFTVDASSGTGVCTATGDTVSFTGAGSCVLDADQAGDNDYAKAPTVTGTIMVQAATHRRAFTADAPPLTAATGTSYTYQFTAAGTPAPTFTLGAGAPSWLTIDPTSGAVTGTPPNGTKSFRYSVTATNTAGSVTAGPFAVSVSDKADLSLALSCPTALTVGAAGTCTLTVTNHGPAKATGVAAGVAACEHGKPRPEGSHPASVRNNRISPFPGIRTGQARCSPIESKTARALAPDPESPSRK